MNSLYPNIVRMLGVDVGKQRIGLAISDVSATIARPLRTIQASSALAERIDAVVDAIAELEKEADGLGGVVVGFAAVARRARAHADRTSSGFRRRFARTDPAPRFAPG